MVTEQLKKAHDAYVDALEEYVRKVSIVICVCTGIPAVVCFGIVYLCVR